VNVTPAAVTSATAAQLAITIPSGVGSGRLTIVTPNGTAVSAEDLIIPPAPYGPSAVASAARIPFATASTVSVPTSQIALRLFDGAAGGRVSLLGTDGVTGQILGCDMFVSILSPSGTSLGSPACVEGTGFIDTKTLAAAGTYSILIDPAGAATGSVTLRLYDVPADYAGTIVPGGSPVTADMSTPGQNGSLTFAGTAGQRISLLGTNGMTGQMSLACDVAVKILRPDGTVLAPATCMEQQGFIDTLTLPSNGTYTIAIDPNGHATGSLTLTLFDVPPDATSSIDVGGSTTTGVTVRGQNARVTFSGISGQRIAVRGSQGMTGQISLACDVTASILRADGSALAAPACMEGSGFIDAMLLPATETYTILVDPVSWATGSLTLTLYDVLADTSATTSVGGPAVTVPLGVGQNGRLTFDANAGQQVTVRLTGNTCGWITVRLLRTDGSQLTSVRTFVSSFDLSTQTLPADGTYTIVLDPGDGNTGSITVAVTSP
jgi:hypothetical protein